MGSSSTESASPSGRSVALTMVGWLGLAACLAMVYLAMRAVMDVGGSCADGGPYVVRQACPEGSAPALFLGIFGGLIFAFLASVGGFGVGGIWAATPLLAWSALFGSLGWNFMDYGVFNSPQGIAWGWAICGVLFWIMAIVPLVGLIPALRGGWLAPARGRGAGGSGRPDPAGGDTQDVTQLRGPGQPALRPIVVTVAEEPPHAPSAAGTPEENREQLEAIAADFGAVIGTAMAEVPLDPDLRASGAADAATEPGSPPEAEFTEGTQALLDRLERLADMRDRALLAPEEYETAKAAIMAELEGRS